MNKTILVLLLVLSLTQ